MPSLPRDTTYLAHMLHHALLVVQHARGSTREQLIPGSLLAGAIKRYIEIVGEAARKVSRDFQTVNPQIPWRQIIATRNILAHDYGGVDYDAVWRIVSIHVPALIECRGPLVGEPPPDPEPQA